MERWRLMEELENIAKNEPVEPGHTISHRGANALGEVRLITRDFNGRWVLTMDGRAVMIRWGRLPVEV